MPAQPVLQQRNLDSARQVKDVPHEGEVPAPIALDPTENYTFEQLQLMMGVSLVLGFTFMLMIDQVGGGGHSHSPGWLNTKSLSQVHSSCNNYLFGREQLNLGAFNSVDNVLKKL